MDLDIWEKMETFLKKYFFLLYSITSNNLKLWHIQFTSDIDIGFEMRGGGDEIEEDYT
jgi:hypothetical protein